MNSKILVFAIFCLFGQITADNEFDYRLVLEKAVNSTDRSISILSDNTLTSYYYQQLDLLDLRFKALAQDVSDIDNPFATAHVHHFRKNYTSVTYLIEKMLEDSRQNIINSFEFQRHHLVTKKQAIDETSREVYFTLVNKNCNDTFLERFYEEFLYGMSNKIIAEMNNAHTAYMTQVEQDYVEFKLFPEYISQLKICATGNVKPMSLTTSCMVQKDDLYLSTTINVVSEKMKSVEDVVANFNLKTTDILVNYIDEAVNKAYRDAALMRC